jgi:cysteine-rich repeat protein
VKTEPDIAIDVCRTAGATRKGRMTWRSSVSSPVLVGVVQLDEECDDGNAADNDLCTNNCLLATCGDGILCDSIVCISGFGGGPEACDDGDVLNSDCCLSDCRAAPGDAPCDTDTNICTSNICDGGGTCAPSEHASVLRSIVLTWAAYLPVER